MSTLFAGGGIRGGQVHGSSDKIAAYPEDDPVAPEDIAKTVYHAMGIDDIFESDSEGRAVPILKEGAPILELF